jgi:RNA polymerase sigma factor (TIGR02999 family)
MPPVELPADPATGPITRALDSLHAGDPNALDELFRHVYPELHELAHRQLMRGRPGETLNTTVLVHELYLKLSAARVVQANDRGHFLAVAARAMRQIIIDAARRMQAVKRGGGAPPPPFVRFSQDSAAGAAELVALDRALSELSELDARLGRTVELRFFGGLTVEETAEVLDVSVRTVKRDWRKARAFLYSAMDGGRAA